jgi:hypothetical protein
MYVYVCMYVCMSVYVYMCICVCMYVKYVLLVCVRIIYIHLLCFSSVGWCGSFKVSISLFLVHQQAARRRPEGGATMARGRGKKSQGSKEARGGAPAVAVVLEHGLDAAEVMKYFWYYIPNHLPEDPELVIAAMDREGFTMLDLTNMAIDGMLR